MSLRRRTVLKGGLAIGVGVAFQPRPLWARADARPVVNDITLLDPVRVSQIAVPRTTDEVRHLVEGWSGVISVGGGRYSMGGQIAAEDSLHLDMRGFNQLVRLDPARKIVRVQTGMRWRDLQSIIDPHDLAVKTMQSYSNFTIGGALSVNAHGRYVGSGPIINSVRSIQVILSGGVTIEASPTREAELFHGAIGGYGALGVITEAELELVPNGKIERRIDRVPIADYRAFFAEQIRNRPEAILHNADLALPDIAEAVAVTWFETDKPVTITERLLPVGASDPLEAGAIWSLAELPGARFLRRELVEPIEQARHPIVWRNHEASLDVASLGRIATTTSTYALEEYFIPVAAFEEFAQQMSRILRVNHVNAVNVSVRHAPADPGAILAWAREEVFSFVLYYRQHIFPEARQHVGNWTRQLIDAALAAGGAYYLPYQLHATASQFERAYPGAARFFALKARVDPRNQFRNRLWEKYARAAP